MRIWVLSVSSIIYKKGLNSETILKVQGMKWKCKYVCWIGYSMLTFEWTIQGLGCMKTSYTRTSKDLLDASELWLSNAKFKW